MRGGAVMNRRSLPCMLTFDVEEWFQVENLRSVFPPDRWETMPSRLERPTRALLELLAEYGVRATFFVLGWVAQRQPGLVRELVHSGHEVASHGYGHILPLTLTESAFEADVARARAVLEDIVGGPVFGYRAPAFSIDRLRLRILAEMGFSYDSSYHPFTLHDRYGRIEPPGVAIAPGVFRVDTTLVEVALPIERIGRLAIPASGGGYFRLYPGPLFRHLARRAIARSGHYVMYLHCWEFDDRQPRVHGIGSMARFRHYNNLSRTLPRLRRFLDMLRVMEVDFMSIQDFVGSVRPLSTQDTWRAA
jgi:polysaccharide deacetylase family protein (PEP-CTERM system associated)